jgi:hypothetical protein
MVCKQLVKFFLKDKYQLYDICICSFSIYMPMLRFYHICDYDCLCAYG